LTEQPQAYAGFLRRLAAGAIDWFLLFLFLTAASFATLPWVGGAAAATAVLGGTALATIAYFAAGWVRRGQTLGMRATGIVVRRREDGEALGSRRAVLRSLVALASGASGFLALALAFGDRPESGYSGVDLAVAGAALLWAEVSVAGHLWQLVDRRKQSWQDKLFGLVVVHAS
jgi:uncharacterized RDD family membrane protein YckC